MARMHITCIIFIVILVSTSGAAYATPPARPDDVLWSGTYDQVANPAGGSVALTPYGGYVIAGEYTYAIGVDSGGHGLWSNSYAEHGYGRFYKAIPTPDKGYMFAGNFSQGYNGTTGDAYIVKAGIKDNQWDNSTLAGYAPLKIFNKTFNVSGCESWLRDGLQEADGSFVFAGAAANVTADGSKVPDSGYVYVIKTDVDGNLLWSSLYEGNGSCAGNSIVRAPDGGYAIAGTVYAGGSDSSRAYLLRIDGNGSKLWDATYPGAGTAEATSLCNAGNEGYVLAGGTKIANDTSNDTARFVVCLVQVSLNGTEVWNCTMDATGTASDVIESSDGGFVAVGTANLPGSTGNGYIVKVNRYGEPEWDRNVGAMSDGLTGVVQAPDDSYVCGGYVKTDNGRLMMWLIDIGTTKGPGYSPVCWCIPSFVLPAVAISIVALRRRRPA